MTTLAPINVATPQWKCPYCGTDYHSDLESAEKCAALGAPAADGAAERIAVWTHGTKVSKLEIVTLGGVTLDGPRFGRYNQAPPEPERRHVQTYSDGTHADEGVGYVEGTMIEHGGERRIDTDHGRRYGSFGLGDTFNGFAGLKRYYNRDGGMRSIHHASGAYGDDYSWNMVEWLGPITPQVAAAFEILVPHAWEWVRDTEKRNEVIRSHMLGERQHRWRGWTNSRNGGSGFEVPGELHLAAVAATHGFEPWDAVGMSRWEFANRDAIDAALWERACAWVDRDGTTAMIAPRITLSIKTSQQYGGELPRLPGVKRVKALAHWGVEYNAGDDGWYQRVLDKVLASLVIDPPTNAIPGVPTATEFSARMSRKAAR